MKKFITRFSIFFAFLVFLFGSCEMATVSRVKKKNDIQTMNDAELEETYMESRNKAYEEFFEDIPTQEDLLKEENGFEEPTDEELASIDENSLPVQVMDTGDGSKEFDDLALREQIELLAFDAAFTGNPAPLEQFLKENDLYDKYFEINEKYQLEELQLELVNREESSRLAAMFERPPNQADDWLWELQSGDIVFSHNPDKIFGYLVPGYWDHCGIIDTRGWGGRSDLRIYSASAVIESHGEIVDHYGDPTYACTGYESIYYYSHQPYASAVRVKNGFRPSAGAIQQGLDYVEQFPGQTYNLFVDKTSTEEWYCSKVVNLVYRKAGLNIERPSFIKTWKIFGQYVTLTSYDFFVSPDDLFYSPFVYELEQYENMPVPAAPIFSMEGGLIKESFMLKLSAQSKSEIYYTTDGSDPGLDSKIYSEPIHVFGSMTVKAIAVNRQGEISPSGKAVYEMDDEAGAAIISLGSGLFNSGQNIEITPDDNTTVHYTLSTDGSEPADPTRTDPECSASFQLDVNPGEDITYRYKFCSFTTIPSRNSAEFSDVLSRIWRIDRRNPEVPQANYGSGLYGEILHVAISAEDGASIYYVLGTDSPNPDSAVYTEPLVLDESTTLRAICVDAAGNTSGIAEWHYQLDLNAEAPEVSLDSDTFQTPQTVIVSPVLNGTVYYTYSSNGSIPEDPTKNDHLYNSPLDIYLISGEETPYIYKFKAFSTLNPDDPGSPVIQRQWTIDGRGPALVTISPSDSGETIYPDSQIILEFSEPVDSASALALANGAVISSSTHSIALTPTVSNDSRSLILTPEYELHQGYEWNCQLSGTVYDTSGIRLTNVSVSHGFTVPVTKPEKIDASTRSVFFINKDGELWTWGLNNFGLLGLNIPVNEYVQTPAFVMAGVKDVSASAGHTLILLHNGDLYSVGSNAKGELGHGSVGGIEHTPGKIMGNVEFISAGYETSYAVDRDGNLYAFGSNDYGQLGIGTIVSNVSSPTFVRSGVKFVEGGFRSAFVILDNDKLYACGSNANGTLGIGSTGQTSTFRYVMDNVALINSEETSSCAVTTGGSLYVWGGNEYGELGLGNVAVVQRTPVLLRQGGVKTASMGKRILSFILDNGDMYHAGTDTYRVTARPQSETSVNLFTPVHSGQNMAAVSVELYLSVGLTADGTVWTAGSTVGNTHVGVPDSSVSDPYDFIYLNYGYLY